MSHDSWLMSDTVFVKYYSIAFSILPGIAGGLALELVRFAHNWNVGIME